MEEKSEYLLGPDIELKICSGSCSGFVSEYSVQDRKKLSNYIWLCLLLFSKLYANVLGYILIIEFMGVF